MNYYKKAVSKRTKAGRPASFIMFSCTDRKQCAFCLIVVAIVWFLSKAKSCVFHGFRDLL